MRQHVLILGAGFGGLELARCLSDTAADEVRVTVIDQNDSFTFGFSKLEIMFGRQTPDQVRLRYRDLGMPSVEFRQEVVTAIDPRNRTVVTDAGTHEADLLVVALGADYVPEATPGFVEDGQEYYSIAGAAALSRLLARFRRGRVVIAVLGVPFKCPPAPYEGALLLHDYLTQRGVRDSSEIEVFTPMAAPIPPSPQSSKAIVAALADRGIGYTPGRRVRSLDPESHVAHLRESEVPYDLFIGIPVHKAPDVVQASGLTEGGNDGWVAVDRRNLRTPFAGVWAIGDCADAPVPRAGVFAEGAARVVAEDIVATVRGGREPDPYPGAGSCYIEFGGGVAGRVDVDFLSGPVPVAPFVPPSREIAAEKDAWAASRRARWFAGSGIVD